MQKKFKLTCIGCQMNKSDSERISAFLKKNGHEQAKADEKCELLIYVTCGVRQSAEDRIYGLIPNDRRANPGAKCVLTGCLSLRPDVREKLADQVDIWMNIKDLAKLPSLLQGLDSSEIMRDCDYLKYEPDYSSQFSALVPIGNGCDNFCSYCVVPHARGREAYRNSEEIKTEVKELLSRGYREINLIAQNVNSYRCPDTNIDFATLLAETDALSPDFWLRFTTSHPKDMSEKLIAAMKKCKNLCHHLHLPAQSGDNEILAAMNRKYKVEDYLLLLSKIRAAMPDILLSTDIIVGSPGETEAQFQNTAELFRTAAFDMTYIAQYSPRPGTAAALLSDNVPQNEKKEREEILTRLLRESALKNSQALLGKELEVLITHANKKKELFGKTKGNKTIRVQANDNISIGDIIKVTITAAQDFGLSAELKSPA